MQTQLKSGKSYDPQIEAILEVFSKKSRGDVATYIEIETASGLSRHTDKNIWSHVIGKVKKKLLDSRGIALRCHNNVGYKMLTADEQLHDQRHERSAARKIRQAGTEKALIRAEELDEHGRAIQVAVVHQADLARDLIRRQGAERKGFLASHETVNQYNRINSLRPRAVINGPAMDATDSQGKGGAKQK